MPFQIRDGRLLVDAPKAASLDIAYTVKAVDADSREAYGLVRDKYTGRIWTLTWPYNTGALFPSNSLPADGATARVTVRVADGATAIAPGARKGSSFSLDAETPAYAIGFYAATDFELGNAGRSKDGVRVSGAGIADEVPKRIRDAYRKTAREALDFYSDWLGAYDFGPSLRLVEVEGELGGMEHASAVAIMLGAAKDPEYSKETAAHEVAHHWFGDNLRIEHWGDFWMSEGFTNYATYRFFRHADGDQKFFAFLDRARDEVRDALKQNPHALIAPPHTDVNEIFDSVPYEMGAWMLRMIEARLGTERFDALLRDWFRSRRGRAVSTADFVAFARAKTKENLKPFFDAWNRITAVPSFDAAVQVDGSTVEVSMKAKTDFPEGLKLPLVVEGHNGQRKTFRVDPSRHATFDAGFAVRSYRWDPERTVMAYVS